MAQFARPSTDTSIGSWTDDASGTTNIYQAIDEVTASDTDYVRSESNPSSSVCTFALSSVTDPASSSGHVVRFRYIEATAGGGSPPTTTLDVVLRQGNSPGTDIASFSDTNVPDAWTDGSITLTGIQADAISDYSDLYLRFTASKTAGARTGWVQVSFAELEVPNAPSAGGPRLLTLLGAG